MPKDGTLRRAGCSFALCPNSHQEMVGKVQEGGKNEFGFSSSTEGSKKSNPFHVYYR